MVQFYVHGYETQTTEDHTDYVVLTTPIAITGEQVRIFQDELVDSVLELADDVILYELRPVGRLLDGLPE